MKVLGRTIRLPSARSNVTDLLNTVSKRFTLYSTLVYSKPAMGKENIFKMERKM